MIAKRDGGRFILGSGGRGIPISHSEEDGLPDLVGEPVSSVSSFSIFLSLAKSHESTQIGTPGTYGLAPFFGAGAAGFLAASPGFLLIKVSAS